MKYRNPMHGFASIKPSEYNIITHLWPMVHCMLRTPTHEYCNFRGGGKTFTPSSNICPEDRCRKGWWQAVKHPPPPPYSISQLIADISYKDDVTVILLVVSVIVSPREDWMIYRGPGFLAVVIRLHPPLPSASCRYFSVFLCVAGRAYWRERGGRGWAWSWSYDRMKAWPSVNGSILSGFFTFRLK